MVESPDFSNVPELSGEWCHYHDRLEPSKNTDYALCAECGHVYRTKKALRRAFDKYIVGNWWWKRITKPTDVKIYVCPLCGHDI